MPTYEYRCDDCDRTFDVVQSFHDDALTACPTCGSPVRKVFGNVGIVFKGSGFYKTDSRGGSASRSKEPKEAATSSAGATDGTGSSDSATKSTAPETAKSPPSAPASTGGSSTGGDAAKAS